MVKRAMLDRQAPDSVESAFAWAKADLERTHPYRVPSISDGIDGDLVLGRSPGPHGSRRTRAGGAEADLARSRNGGGSSNGGSSGEPAATPPPGETTTGPRSKSAGTTAGADLGPGLEEGPQQHGDDQHAEPHDEQQVPRRVIRRRRTLR